MWNCFPGAADVTSLAFYSSKSYLRKPMALNVFARGPIYPKQFLISYSQVWYQQWMDGSFGGFAFINHKCVHPFYSLIYIPYLLGLS